MIRQPEVSHGFPGDPRKSSLLSCLRNDISQPVSGAARFSPFGLHRRQNQVALKRKATPPSAGGRNEQAGPLLVISVWLIQRIELLGVIVTACPPYSIYRETEYLFPIPS